MFQVAVEVCGVASVLMVVVLSLCFRCVMTIIVATNILWKTGPLLRDTHRLEVADCAKAKAEYFQEQRVGDNRRYATPGNPFTPPSERTGRQFQRRQQR